MKLFPPQGSRQIRKHISFSLNSGGLKTILLSVALLSACTFSACSPKSLFGGGGDQSSDSTPTYQPLNRQCTNLDLSATPFQGQELRAVLKCFNQYGALDPIQKLFDRLSDDQVQAFVQMGNQHLIADHRLLYDLERSYYDEKNTGALTPSLQALGSVAEKPELISAVLSLLDSSQPQLEKDSLGLLQTLGAHFNSQTAADVFSLGMNIAGSRAFESLQEKLQTSQAPRSSAELSVIVADYLRLLESANRPGSYSLLTDLSKAAQSGILYKGLDNLLGGNQQTIASNVPNLLQILPTIAANDGEILEGTGELIRGLSSPVNCLRNTVSAVDPVLHLFSDISSTADGGGGEYIRSNHLLTIVALEPFCNFPEATETQYTKLVKLADSSAMYGTERLIKAWYPVRDAQGKHALALMLEGFLSDPDGLKKVPLIQELSNRNAWGDIFLLAALPDSDDRAKITELTSFLATASPYFSDQSSPKDALTRIMLAAGPSKLLDLANALKTYINQKDPLAYPALDGFRGAFSSNDAHPFIEFARKLLADAPQQQLFFKTLFSVAQYPEFKQSLQLIARMAKDGRLGEMYGDAVVIFHGLANNGAHPVAADVALPFSPSRRHDLSSNDLQPASPHVQITSADVCALLTPNSTLDDIAEPSRLNHEWDRFLACLSAKGNYEDVKSDVNYLRATQTSDGRSELVFGIDQIREFSHALSTPDVKYFADLWVKSEDNGKFSRILDTASNWISHQLFRPLLDWCKPVLDQGKSALRNLETFAAGVLVQENFPKLLLEVDRIFQMKPDPETEIAPVDYDKARVDRWIQNKECEEIPENTSDAQHFLQMRYTEIVRDYEQGVTSYADTGPGSRTLPELSPKLNWTVDELKVLVEPFLKLWADPGQSDPNHTVTDAVLGFLGFYSLEPGQQPNSTQHFTPTDLADWFYDRATDKKLITQYYLGDPPDAHPRVRYVDSLDRLELVLTNADFDALAPILDRIGIRLGVNIGKMSLAEIGDSWGDEPYELWPDEIKAKYAGSTPPTLRQTITRIGKILEWLQNALGYPALPRCNQQADPNDSPALQQVELSNHEPTCHAVHGIAPFPAIPGCLSLPDVSEFDLRNMKRRLYNIAQVFDVLTDNLPGSGTSFDGGMKFLRDIIYQFNYSSLPQNRGTLAALKNNLSFITFIARSGIDRQVAFDLRRFKRNDPFVRDFFGALVSVARDRNAAKRLVDHLIVQDTDHSMLWNFAKSLYPYMGNPFPENNPPRIFALRTKQSIYFGLGSLERLGLVPLVVQQAASILDQDFSYINSETDQLADALASSETAWLTRAFYGDRTGPGKDAIEDVLTRALQDQQLLPGLVGLSKIIQERPDIRGAFDTFKERLDAMNGEQSYQQLHADQLKQDILSFFEERSGSGASTNIPIQADRDLRKYLAERLNSGDLDQVLELIAQDPSQFEKLLDTASKYIKTGQIKDFFDYLRAQMNPVN